MSATVADVLRNDARWCVRRAFCDDFAAGVPSACVDLLWLDPPYFRIVDEKWDRAWQSEREYFEWLRVVVAAADKVLAPCGSLYIFASPEMAARVEVLIAERFRVLNSITWAKPERSLAEKYGVENFRRFVPMSERVIFAEKRGQLGGSVLGDELRAMREACGFSQDDLDIAAGHTLAKNQSKGSGLVRLQELGERMPSQADWVGYWRAMGDVRSDNEIATEYLRLARPFSAPKGFTDVWTYTAAPNVPHRHPCEKPQPMLRDAVLASTRDDGVVCEFFGGSFRMAETALSLGRRYVGCDADEHWAEVGRRRASAEVSGKAAAVPSRHNAARPAAEADFGPLFGGSL